MMFNLRLVQGIEVADADRARQFYLDKFGFRVGLSDAKADSSGGLIIHTPVASTGLVLVEKEDHRPTRGKITLICENLDQAYDELTAKGVETHGRPSLIFGIRTLYARDSEQNVVEIYER